MNLTPEQYEELKEAVYLIADARTTFESLNKEMIKAKNLEGQGNIAEVLKSLNSLCETRSGGIGIYLEKM